MHNLGAFFGHVARAVRQPVIGADAASAEVGRHSTEQTVNGPKGTITLRRTVIDEVEIRPGEVSHEQADHERGSVAS
jgi:hypothetical protein